VAGRHGHIFDYEDGKQLGVVLLDSDPGAASKARTLLRLRKKALAAGFIPHQLGDCESVLLFDPHNSAQARLALRLVGVRVRRRLSDEHRHTLAATGRGTQYGRRQTALQADLATPDAR
jgi:hypothetical protein